MEKTVKTYSLDSDIAEKFAEQTPSRKTSEKLEELMADYIDEEAEKDPVFELWDKDLMSKKRNKFCNLILESLDGRQAVIKSKLTKKARNAGIYSQKSHIKDAIKFMIRSEEIPLRSEGRKLIDEDFLCRADECTSVLTPSMLMKQGRECPKCGAEYKW